MFIVINNYCIFKCVLMILKLMKNIKTMIKNNKNEINIYTNCNS